MATTIANTNAATSGGAAAPSVASPAKTATAKEINDRFLTLLVAQIKNQDPLNPIDNAQFTSQLAQINTVTGIESLNKTVQSLVDQMSGLQSMQASSLAGREVMVAGNRIDLGSNGEASASGSFELTQAADDAVVSIKDSAGRLVREIHLGSVQKGLQSFAWDGAGDAGGRTKAGAYTFELSARAAGKTIDAQTLARGRVEGVIRSVEGSGAVQLNLGALGTYALSDVRQIM